MTGIYGMLRRYWFVPAALLIAAVIIAVVISRSAADDSGIVMPSLSGGNYETVVARLEEAGYTDVRLEKETHDAQWRNVWAADGDIASIKIRDKNAVEGKSYPQDVPIIVTYYEFD